jgi:hypothetical protein
VYLLCVTLLCVTLFWPVSKAFASTAAVNITPYCTFTPSSNNGTFIYALDGNYSTKWYSAIGTSRTIELSVSGPTQVGGIYFVWDSPPAQWELFAYENGGGQTSILTGGSEGYLTQYVVVPLDYAGCRQFKLVMTPQNASSAVNIADLTVYSPGDPPYYAPTWQPLANKVDLMTITSHPDDEDLYLGVPAPTYVNQGMNCVTVYMTYGSASNSVRRFEAQESAWSLGNKVYPAMGNFADVKTLTKEDQMRYWPLNDTIGFVERRICAWGPYID